MADSVHLLDTATASPLYRCVTDPDSKLTKYLIAYRAVTLIPFARPGEPQMPAVPYGDANTTTVMLTLGEGNLTQQNIEIHAEDLYLYVGSSFWFPGKHVTITANRIYAVPNPDTTSTSSTIEFDCSGVNPDGVTTPADGGDNGHDGNAIYTGAFYIMGELKRQGSWNWLRAEPGKGGTNGANGADGGSGGSLTITGRLLSIEKAQTSLYLNVCGGKGGFGQDGGNGGKGGSLTGNNSWDDYMRDIIGSEDFPWGRLRDLNRSMHLVCADPMVSISDILGPGGAGGDGGDAGQFGKGGLVATKLTSNGLFLVKTSDPALTKPIDVAGGKGGLGRSRGDLLGFPGSVGLGRPWYDTWYDVFGGGFSFGKLLIPPLTGPKGKDGLHVSGTIDQGLTQDVADPGSLLDPVHIIMIVQRLLFEYQMEFGTQVYSSLEEGAATTRTDQFKETLGWIDNNIQLLKSKVSLSKESSITHHPSTEIGIQQPQNNLLVQHAITAYEQLLANMRKLLDAYGNQLNAVPNPNIAINDVLSDIKALEEIEARQGILADALADRQKKAADISTASQQFFQTKDALHNTLVDLAGQLKTQYQVVQGLEDTLRVKKQLIVDDLKDFWREAEKSFDGCKVRGWQGVLGAVGSVLMSAQEVMSAAYKVGGALSVASAGADIQGDDSNIMEDALERKVYLIEEGVEGLQLQTQIQKANADSLALRGPDPNVLTTIIAERNKFTQLCDQYFDDRRFPGVLTVKAAFDDFIANVQNLRVGIRAYNTLALAYTKAQGDEAIASQSLDILASTNGQLSAPDFDLVYAYYTHAATQQKAATIRTLYEGVRAYNCASLQYSAAFDAMACLGSFDNVDSQILQTAFLTTLKAEVHAFDSLSNTSPPTLVRDRTISITAGTHPFLFSQFKAHRLLSLYPTTATKAQYSIESEWWDVRLDDFRIFLVGAKNSRAVSDDDKQVSVFVTFGSVFTVQDEHFDEHDFQVPSKTLTYTYSYANSPNYISESSKPPVFTTGFKFSTDPNDSSNNYVMPLSSPFTHWKIQVDSDPEVLDLSGLTEIRVQMDFWCRTIPVKSTKFILPKELTGSTDNDKSVNQVQQGGVHKRPEIDPQTTISPQAETYPQTQVCPSTESYPQMEIETQLDIEFPTSIQLRHFSDSLQLSTDEALFLGQLLRRFRIAINTRRPYSSRETLTASTFGNFAKSFFKSNRQSIPFGESAFRALRPYGATPAIQASNMIFGTDPEVHRRILTDLAKLISTKLDQSVAESGRRDLFSFNAYQVGIDGHLALNAGAVKSDLGNNLFDLNRGPITMLNAFPYYKVLIFSPARVEDLGRTKDWDDYIAANLPQIVKETEEMRRNGADLTGCMAKLGSQSFIAIHSMDQFETEDKSHEILCFTAVTREKHPFRGANKWVVLRSKDRPDEVIFLNIMVGKAPRFADVANTAVGEFIMSTTWDTVMEVSKAFAEGKGVFQHIADTNPSLYTAHLRMNIMDMLVGRPMATVMAIVGTDIEFGKVNDLKGQELTVTDNQLRSGNFPTTAEPGGLLLDGCPVHAQSYLTGQDCTAAGDSPLNPWSQQQRDTAAQIIDTVTKYKRSSEDLNAIRNSIHKIVDVYVAQFGTDKSGNVHSTDEIWSTLTRETAFGEDVGGALREALLEDDTLAAIGDEIFNHKDFVDINAAGDIKSIQNLIMEVSNSRVIWELYQPGGLVETWTRQKIETILLPQIQQLDTKAAIDNALKAYQDQEEIVNQAIADRDKLVRDDPRVKDAEKKVLEEQEALDELDQGAKEASEVQDIAENSEERQSEYQKKEDDLRETTFHEGEGK